MYNKISKATKEYSECWGIEPAVEGTKTFYVYNIDTNAVYSIVGHMSEKIDLKINEFCLFIDLGGNNVSQIMRGMARNIDDVVEEINSFNNKIAELCDAICDKSIHNIIECYDNEMADKVCVGVDQLSDYFEIHWDVDDYADTLRLINRVEETLSQHGFERVLNWKLNDAEYLILGES